MDTFNRTNVYDTVFFNALSVTEYKDTETFEKAEPEKFQIWESMAKKRYKDKFEAWQDINETYRQFIDKLYLNKACFLPEFSKIVAITYATAKADSTGKGIIKDIKKIEGDSEVELLYLFCTVLDMKYDEDRSTVLCGHNISTNDIPLLVKRIIKYRGALAQERPHVVPQLIKNYLKGKPWDSHILDTVNMWKFNGTDFITLNLISEFMGLKKKIKLLDKDVLNHYYWENIEKNPKETLTTITRQSGSFTNIAFQLVDTLRQL